MKRVAAIVFSLMLLGLQVMSAAPSAPGFAPAGRGCGCAKRACCAAASPVSQPTPAAPAPAGPQQQLCLLTPTLVAWVLPATTPSVAPLDSFATFATQLPLFTRHCSFLI